MSSFVTFDNFYDELKFYCHGQPKKAAGLGEIVTGIDHPLADVWINYAIAKGWPQRAEFFRKMLRSGNSLTMPCANPKDFDPGYVAQGQAPAARRYETTTQDVEGRQSIAAQVREVVAKSRPPVQRRRGDLEPEAPMSPAEILAGLKEKGAKEPVAISPALAGRLGLRKLDQAAE